jgi:hypothetical protein
MKEPLSLKTLIEISIKLPLANQHAKRGNKIHA